MRSSLFDSFAMCKILAYFWSQKKRLGASIKSNIKFSTNPEENLRQFFFNLKRKLFLHTKLIIWEAYEATFASPLCSASFEPRTDSPVESSQQSWWVCWICPNKWRHFGCSQWLFCAFRLTAYPFLLFFLNYYKLGGVTDKELH